MGQLNKFTADDTGSATLANLQVAVTVPDKEIAEIHSWSITSKNAGSFRLERTTDSFSTTIQVDEIRVSADGIVTRDLPKPVKLVGDGTKVQFRTRYIQDSTISRVTSQILGTTIGADIKD